MGVLHRSRRLARLAGCAALVFGMAGAAGVSGTALAQARVRLPVFGQHGVASWGVNEDCQLGNGTNASSALFGPVSGLSSGIVQVAAGNDHGLALRTDGTVWAWGRNDHGELGDGTQLERCTPVQVMGLTGVIAVSAGVQYSLALRSDGTVWAWGSGKYGQLGNGVTSLAQLTPVQVTGLGHITQISAGAAFGEALRSDGTVWAWGYNADGELGNGTYVNSSVPVQVKGLSQVTRINAGGDRLASLAVSTSSTGATTVWAWGENKSGELGDGTVASRSTPEQVTGISVPGIAGMSLGKGFDLVLGTDGSVWAWGTDVSSQLGIWPLQAPVTKPIRTIGAGSGIIQLAAGLDHVLAVRSSLSTRT